jgi:hypothetical protein
MPEIKRFSGFKLLMFFQDENPPLRKSASRIAN